MIAKPTAEGDEGTTRFGSYAGFVSRFAAWMIDMGIILGSLYGTALVVSTIVALFSLEQPSFPVLPPLVFAVSFSAWTFVYLFVGWSVWGKTFGKAILGLRVLSKDGQRLPPVRCAVRVLGYVVSSLFFFMGYVWIAISRRRRGWHDHLAGSCVVYDWRGRTNRVKNAFEERLERASS